MRYGELVERVREHLGLPSDAAARRLVAATLGGLGGALPAVTRGPLLHALPPEITRAMGALPPGTIASADALEGHVTESTKLGLGAAIEAAKSVCASLAELLDPDHAERLRRHLPPELAAWLEPPPERPAPPARARPRRSRRSLAEGRAGAGARSLGEARFTGHSGSVARSEEPHADRKLSSASDAPSPGGGSTLATGRPGSERPIGGV